MQITTHEFNGQTLAVYGTSDAPLFIFIEGSPYYRTPSTTMPSKVWRITRKGWGNSPYPWRPSRSRDGD